MSAKYIEEIPLYFAKGSKDIDPKRGLSIYGPSDSIEGGPQTIRVGIVSTSSGIQDVTYWITHCNDKSVESDGTKPFQTQRFPGFLKAFNCRLLLSTGFNEPITNHEISSLLDVVNPNLRIKQAAELYAKKVGIISRRNPSAEVIICHEPHDVEDKCGAGLTSREKKMNALSKEEKKEAGDIKKNIATYAILTPLDEDTLSLVDMSVNQDFRAILKADCLEHGIPTQILTHSALFAMLSKISKLQYSGEGDQTEIRRGRELRQDASTIAWNVAVGLYYKSNHFPWRAARASR